MQLSRRHAIGLASGTLFAVISGAARANALLRVGGTGSATELLNVLALAYQKVHATNINVVPGLGSSGGIQAMRDKVLDLAVSARPLKADEAKAGLVASPFARSPFVFATSHSKPGSHSVRQIAAMVADPRSQWPDGTPVRAILRPRNESDTGLVTNLFPVVGEAIEVARKRADVPVAVNDQDNASMAERLQGSLITISLAQVRLEKRNLRVIEIDGVEPSLTGLENGKYPYGRELYLAHAEAPSSDVKDFLAFLRSTDGARILQQYACLPIA